jgi:hypothetical protein
MLKNLLEKIFLKNRSRTNFAFTNTSWKTSYLFYLFCRYLILIWIVSLCGLDGHKACLEESGDGHGEAVHVEHGQQQQPVLPCIKSSKFLHVMRTTLSKKSCDTVHLNFVNLDLMIFDAVWKVFFIIIFPGPWKYLLNPFEVFRKFGKIFATKGAPPVSMTLFKKVPTGVGWHWRQIYRWCGEYIFSVIYTDHSDTGSKFANDVVDTDGKFAAGAMTLAVDSCNNIRLPSP